MAELEIIAALSSNLVIGRNGQIPWRLAEDLRHFKEITMGHTVIMGRVTFESIGKCLPGRDNVVVSSSMTTMPEGPKIAKSLSEALTLASKDKALVIGGARLYAEALPYAKVLHLTRIYRSFEGDTYFPTWQDYPFELVSSRSFSSSGCGFNYSFETWVRS